LLDFTFEVKGRFVSLPRQDRQEIAGILQILAQLKPISMIEIGILSG
jgi:hypothetical protein